MRMWTMLIVVLGLAFNSATARADDDVAAAQTVIRSQAEAIAREDAAAAYSYASPGIQNKFPEAGVFLGMVRDAYPPIYRHKTFEFGEARGSDGTIAQQVHILDADGVAWEALYTLERQSDGSMKITGCVLVKVDRAV